MPENVARHIELDIVEGQVVPVLKKRLHDDLMDLDVPISDADTEVLRRLFNRIDKDRSGSISREELLGFMRDDVDTRSLMFGHPKLAPLLRPKSWRQAFDYAQMTLAASQVGVASLAVAGLSLALLLLLAAAARLLSSTKPSKVCCKRSSS